MEAAALYVVAQRRDSNVVYLPHITHQVDVTAGNCEKGRDSGSRPVRQVIGLMAPGFVIRLRSRLPRPRPTCSRRESKGSGNMKPNHSLIFLSLTMLASVFLACGPVNAVVNKAIGGNSDMRAVSQLWDDVPAMDGMGAAQQVEMPVWLKALTGPILDGMMKGLNDGQSAGHWDWTAFTLSGKTPDDVQAFYTPERMANTGWKQSESGCIPMADQGTLCTFTKEDQGKTTGLVIIAASDDQKKETSIFFLRAEGLPGTPGPG